MGNAAEVIAGGAVVLIGTEDSQYQAGLGRAEKRLKAFAVAASAMGAKLAGYGLGLGAGLLVAGKAFASTGKELTALQDKMKGLKTGSDELIKLREEAGRLSAILGGEDVQAAVKLSKSFDALRDAVSGTIVKFGGVLAPALMKIIDYLKQGVGAVAQFIDRNRSLAPQVAIVAAVLVGAGVAIGLLGAAFYVAGPVIRLAMVGATAATMAYGVVAATVNGVVSVASAVLKVLSATVSLVSVGYKALTVATVSFKIAAVAANLAAKAIGVTFGIVFAAGRAVTVLLVTQAALWTLTKLGMIGAAASLKTLIFATRLYTAAQLASAAASALTSLGIVGLIGIGVGLVAAFFMWTDAGQRMWETLSSGFEGLKESVVSVFSGIGESGNGMTSGLSEYFSNLLSSASQAFSGVVSVAQSAFESAKVFFLDLFGVAKDTFSGISDAISAGNIQLAMDILWAGLKVSWAMGANALKSVWTSTVVYIEGAFDSVGTNLKMIWDVSLAYLEGAFDQFVLYIRNAMQGVSNYIAETLASIDPTGYFGDLEAVQEENARRSEDLNKGVQGREDGRNNRIANAGDDEGARTRAGARQNRLDAITNDPQIGQLKGELGALLAQAAAEKAQTVEDAAKRGQPGSEAAQQVGSSMATAAAQARGSAGASSTIAKAANSQSSLPEQQLAVAKSQVKEAQKTNTLLSKQQPGNITITQRA
jgi:hypothetical protein